MLKRGLDGRGSGMFYVPKTHVARKKHPKEYISADIKKLKEIHTYSLLSVTYLDAIFQMGSGKEDCIGEGK